jgi:branched-chain amino acid transport system permease protein
LQRGNTALILTIVYIIFTSYMVTQNPRSLLWRMLFMASILFIFRLPNRFAAKAILALIVVFIIVPILGAINPFLLELGFQVAIMAALASGLNVVVGFAGLLDLGYVAFYAIGAYSWAIFGSQQLWLLTSQPGTAPQLQGFPLGPELFWLFVFLGVGMAALFGIVLGLPVLRLRGDYLAIVTLGFGEVIRVLANNLDKPINLTNGPQGITPIQRPPLPDFLTAGPVYDFLSRIAGKPLNDGELYNLFFYLIALFVLVVVIIVVSRMENSRVGRAWTAIREDEVAALAMGIPLTRTKLTAFASGAAFAGAMGVIFAANRTFVSPETFSLTQSIMILVMVILGGLGSIPGVVLGAALVTLLNIDILQYLSLELSRLRQGVGVIPILNMPWADLPSQLDPARYQKLVFGIILVVMMIFRPAGILPSKRRAMELQEADAEEETPDYMDETRRTEAPLPYEQE